MLMLCAGNRSRPNRYRALFFKAGQERCHYLEFDCMNAMIFLQKLGMMAGFFWECAKRLALPTVCMCLLFPIHRTRSSLGNAITRADTVIVTSQKRQSAVNMTSVRARWRILRNCATL